MSELTIRQTKEEDYPELCRHWSYFRFPAPPQDMLPENGRCGLLVEKDGVFIVASFLYFTNSKICWQEFLISSSDIKDRELIKNSIQFLITSLAEVAKSKGFEVMFTSVKHPSLINHYKEVGFVVGSENTKEMIMRL